jgi:catechol 2,3-dioxygenase
MPEAPPLPANLSLGPVRLRVADKARALGFYRDRLGLSVLSEHDDRVALGAGTETVIDLLVDGMAKPKPRGSTGLFHAAILLPDRSDLAAMVARLRANATRFSASDHLVSEALYLWDPDGNGIEIYRDRPRGAWRWSGGRVAMDTLPLNFADLLTVLSAGGADAPMPAGTRLGHMHLQVADLEQAHGFYVETLGFELVCTYPGALFVSAGGYHHHLGLNIWESADGAPPPVGAAGLIDYEVRLPTGADVEALAARVTERGAPIERTARGFVTADPWNNRLVIVRA